MWDLLGGIVRTFLLLRDLFGYLIPGTVLLGSIVYGHGFSWAQKSWPGGPEWLAVVAAVIGCYVTGQILVAIGYTVYEIVDKFRTRQGASASADDLLFSRYIYPDLFIELDRRGTINIMRIGLAVALIADGWLLAPPLNYGALILGLLTLYNGYTGKKHVAEYGAATVKAGRTALENKVPFVVRK